MPVTTYIPGTSTAIQQPPTSPSPVTLVPNPTKADGLDGTGVNPGNLQVPPTSRSPVTLIPNPAKADGVSGY